jgi:hypothetical protein
MKTPLLSCCRSISNTSVIFLRPASRGIAGRRNLNFVPAPQKGFLSYCGSARSAVPLVRLVRTVWKHGEAQRATPRGQPGVDDGRTSSTRSRKMTFSPSQEPDATRVFPSDWCSMTTVALSLVASFSRTFSGESVLINQLVSSWPLSAVF